MGIHGDDVVRAIRQGLSEHEICPSQTEMRNTPAGDGRGWPLRDGLWQFDAIGRDWFRAFRITIEAIDVDEVEGYIGQAFELDGSFRVGGEAK